LRQPHGALADQVSDPGNTTRTAATPDNLICPASAIFDQPKIRTALEAALADAADPMEVRSQTVRILAEARATEAERLAVMAVGGYGRGEMAAHSDVDLLFLNPYKITPWAESLIESMLYIGFEAEGWPC